MTPEAAEELSTRVNCALKILDAMLVEQPHGGQRDSYRVVAYELTNNLVRVREELRHCQTMLEDG